MYRRRVLASTFKYTQAFMRSNCTDANICTFNRNKNIVRRSLPQICTVEKNYGQKFYERPENSPRTELFILSGSFLFTLFGSDDEEKDDVEELKMTIKRSILLIQKEEFKKAEQMLHVALRQAQTLQHYDGITYVYDVMANLAYSMNDFEKAEKLFVAVLQRLIAKQLPQDDLAVIHISLKIANIYERMGDMKKAENGYQFCLQNLENHMAKDNENIDVLQLLGLSLEWYAAMLFSQSRYREAFNIFVRAYDVSLKINGEEHEETVVLLNDLGTLSCMLKENDQAIQYLSKALEIGEKLPEMDDLGSIHVNLGNIFIAKGMYEEAEKSCTEGMNLAKMKNHDASVMEAEKCLQMLKELMS